MQGAPFPMDAMLGLCWIGFFLIVGMYFRAKVRFFRRYLIPSCLIGGVVGFFANTFGALAFIGMDVPDRTFQTIIYHIFNLTWIYLGLQRSSDDDVMDGECVCPDSADPAATRKKFRLQLWTGAAIVLGFSVCLSTNMLAGIGMKAAGISEPASLGMLVAVGFTGGPGQAMTNGAIWESQGGLVGTADFALAGASMGFVMAMLLGIPLMSILARRRNITTMSHPTESEQAGYYLPNEGPSTGRQTTAASSIDTFAWHLALGFFAYLLLLLVYNVLGKFLSPTAMSIMYALLFIAAMLTGLVVRKVVARFHMTHLCCRNVTGRINGLLVDFLACGTFITIQAGAINQYLLPFIVYSLISTLTIAGVGWYLYRNMANHAPERFGVYYGTLTGTISTGLVLSRIVDPENRSPAAVDFGIGNLFAFPVIVMVGPLLHTEVLFGRSPWIIFGFFFVTGIIGFVLVHWFKQEQYKPLGGTEQVPDKPELAGMEQEAQ